MPRSWPRGPAFCAVAFKGTPSVRRGGPRDSSTPAGRRQLPEPERDDSPVDEPARERIGGDDLDAVHVAKEPLEVDEHARADGIHLLEARQVVDGDTRAQGRVVEEPGNELIGERGQDERGLLALGQLVADLDAAPFTTPGELESRRRLRDELDIVERVAAVDGEGVEHLALGHADSRPLDLAAARVHYGHGSPGRVPGTVPVTRTSHVFHR